MALNLYTVETAIFEKINALLPSTTGSQGELPGTTTGETPRLFGLGIGMGDEPVQVPQSGDYFALTVELSFRGLYGSREHALNDISSIYEALPYSSVDVAGVDRVDIPSGPSITRTIWERANDQDHGGGEERLWAVEIPLRATIPND